MADPEHLAKLQEALACKDIRVWNAWVLENRIHQIVFRADLSGATLRGANLANIDLIEADLTNVDLSGANLCESKMTSGNLTDTNLVSATLVDADLRSATFFMTDLSNADLSNARLHRAKILSSLLESMKLIKASIGETVFANVNLSNIEGLDSVVHLAPSSMSIDTFYRSGGNIPEAFLRGCGVPETMITFAKSLVGKPIQYYSAFIAYSSQDENFARMLYNYLQMSGVRVWFAAEDLKIGETIEDSIDQAIRVYDKLIIVLSQNSIERAWVRKEFSKAVDKEKQHGKTVLFPIRLDDSVFETSEQWAYDIRKRHIGDFRNWTNPFLYQNAINRLLRDLNAGT